MCYIIDVVKRVTGKAKKGGNMKNLNEEQKKLAALEIGEGKVKHTVGPWKIVGKSIKNTEGYGDDTRVCTMNFSIPRLKVKAGELEAQANANLIAAAPELLEACKEALHTFKTLQKIYGNKIPGFSVEIKQLKQAIEKAEGL